MPLVPIRGPKRFQARRAKMSDIISLVVGILLTALGVLLALWIAGVWNPSATLAKVGVK
jgi:hypothetical protein